jgi:uncharacterized membrane protein YciS (DUF1049 family)
MIGFIEKLMSFLFAVLGVAALLFFTFMHKDSVSLMWSPLHERMETPISLIATFFFAIGFIVGAVMVWANGHKKRQDHSALKKQVKTLQKDVENARQSVPGQAVIVQQDKKAA